MIRIKGVSEAFNHAVEWQSKGWSEKKVSFLSVLLCEPLTTNVLNTCGSMKRRIDARAVCRDRTQAEKHRRHLYGENGATFSKGKYQVLRGRVCATITTFSTKDNQIAEIYETE